MTARAWLLFAAVSLVWGIPYFFIKVAVEAGVPPGFVAWSRVAMAALLLPLAWRRGALRGLAGRWRAVAAYTACEVAVPFVLIAAGERYIASSLAAILIASMPLMVALLSARLAAADRPTGLRLAGLVLGFGGVVALLGIDLAGRPGELLGAALVLVATLCYAMATIIVDRRLGDLDPMGPIAASLGLATLVLAPAALLAPPDGLPSGAALGSLVVLGVVCTALGLVLFFGLVVEAGPSRAAVITYVNPVVAVVLGVLALDERLGATAVAGLLAILAGSWLATAGRNDPRRRSGAPDAGGRGVGGRRAEKGRAGHRASNALTRTRHSRRTRTQAWLASAARWARRARWCRARWASARSSATWSAASCCIM
jgi:drug/metabolite transporter (DMT)-like permease